MKVENEFPMCPECGEQLDEPLDGENVSVEWCSSCGARCVVARKLVAMFEIDSDEGE